MKPNPTFRPDRRIRGADGRGNTGITCFVDSSTEEARCNSSFCCVLDGGRFDGGACVRELALAIATLDRDLFRRCESSDLEAMILSFPFPIDGESPIVSIVLEFANVSPRNSNGVPCELPPLINRPTRCDPALPTPLPLELLSTIW